MFRITYNTCRSVSKLSNIGSMFTNRIINSPVVPITCKINNNTFSIKYCTNVKSDVQKEKSKSEHIYLGTLKNQVISVKVFSLTSSFLGVCFQPILYEKYLAFGLAPTVLALASMVSFFTFVTPFLLHFITKKYVTDIDYNPTTKVYTATLYTFFLRKKKIEFTPADVEIPEMPGMFTTMHIKKTPVFIELVYFKDPTHYAKIMGYDKPIHFKLESDPAPEGDIKK